MHDEESNEIHDDLFSEVSDVGLVRHLLADLHDDLQGKVTRFHYLADLGAELGSEGTMLFGGEVTFNAWTEARSSFVHGNFVATVLLCQSLMENLLAAFLHGGMMDELPSRIQFDETLRRCREKQLLLDDDVIELKKLVSMRNPLTHFRNFNDTQNLTRRAVEAGRIPGEVLVRDAWFAISLATRILAKKPFRLG